MVVDKIPEEKEREVFTNPEIPEEQVILDQGYYRYVYFMLRFKKEVCVESE